MTGPGAGAVEAVELLLPGNAEYVGTARMAAGEAAIQAGLDHETMCDVRLAVSEACAHVLRCAGGVAGYSVRFTYGNNALDVEVEQTGGEMEVGAPTDDDSAGLGLILIHDLSDEFSIEEGGRVRLTMRFVARTDSAGDEA